MMSNIDVKDIIFIGACIVFFYNLLIIITALVFYLSRFLKSNVNSVTLENKTNILYLIEAILFAYIMIYIFVR